MFCKVTTNREHETLIRNLMLNGSRVPPECNCAKVHMPTAPPASEQFISRSASRRHRSKRPGPATSRPADCTADQHPTVPFTPRSCANTFAEKNANFFCSDKGTINDIVQIHINYLRSTMMSEGRSPEIQKRLEDAAIAYTDDLLSVVNEEYFKRANEIAKLSEQHDEILADFEAAAHSYANDLKIDVIKACRTYPKSSAFTKTTMGDQKTAKTEGRHCVDDSQKPAVVGAHGKPNGKDATADGSGPTKNRRCLCCLSDEDKRLITAAEKAQLIIEETKTEYPANMVFENNVIIPYKVLSAGLQQLSYILACIASPQEMIDAEVISDIEQSEDTDNETARRQDQMEKARQKQKKVEQKRVDEARQGEEHGQPEELTEYESLVRTEQWINKQSVNYSDGFEGDNKLFCSICQCKHD